MHCSSKIVSAFQCKICGPYPDGITEELNAFVLDEMLSLNFYFIDWLAIKKGIPDLDF